MIFQSKFDLADLSDFDTKTGTPTVINGELVCTKFKDGVTKLFSPQNTLYVAFKLRIGVSPTQAYILKIRNSAGTEIAWLGLTLSDNLQPILYVYTNIGGDAARVGQKVLSTQQTYLIQVKFEAAINGEYRVSIDGADDIIWSGIDTSTATANEVDLGELWSVTPFDLMFDDLAIDTIPIEEPPIPPPLPPPSGLYDYTILGLPNNYIGQDKIGNIIASSPDLTAVWNAVLSLMSAGQTLEFIGVFALSPVVNIQKTITMNFRQATMALTGLPLKIYVVADVVGGRWVGQGTTYETYNSILIVTAAGCRIEGVDAENIQIASAYGSSYTLFLDSIFHDGVIGGIYFVNLTSEGGGHHTVVNCEFKNNVSGGVFVSNLHPYTRFLGCKFSGLNSHGIYVDGSVPALGGHIIAGCDFDNQLYQAAIQCKCKNNIIGRAIVDGISYSGNNFHDFPAGLNAVAISIYSEYVNTTANDNEVFGNTFTDLDMAIWLGHDGSASPALRNKIYDNVFTRIRKHCIGLNPWIANGVWNYVDDTKIYYNEFHDCSTVFKVPDSPLSWIRNTVIARNVFDPSLPPAEVALLKSLPNVMIYGNVGLDDFNPVTDSNSPYWIPPKGYIPPVTVDLQINIPVNGSTTPTGTQTVATGLTVTVTATADTGYSFKNWLLDGADAGSINPVTVTVDMNHTLDALFEQTTTPPSGCFIATACGTSNVHLATLRRFRDQCLPLPLVHAYYRSSPPLANRIRPHGNIKKVFRKVIEWLTFQLKKTLTL